MSPSLPHVHAGEAFSEVGDPVPPEADLVRAVLDGDADAFASIVRLHGRRVYNFVHQMTRHAQDAEDLTQQTFIKAFNSLDRFDLGRPMINWLLTIARRTTLNHFRSARRWEAIDDEIAGSAPNPASDAERHDQVDNLWERARHELSRREFEVMWLRFAEELSVDETARVTGLTRPHVKVLVFRARRRLMRKILLP